MINKINKWIWKKISKLLRWGWLKKMMECESDEESSFNKNR